LALRLVSATGVEGMDPGNPSAGKGTSPGTVDEGISLAG